MTRVYGGCIEPEGMDLDDEHGTEPCPRCDTPAINSGHVASLLFGDAGGKRGPKPPPLSGQSKAEARAAAA